jgi:hypothetical protein
MKISCENTHNKAPKQGSVRCAHSAGRAEGARPLARRYEELDISQV